MVTHSAVWHKMGMDKFKVGVIYLFIYLFPSGEALKIAKTNGWNYPNMYHTDAYWVVFNFTAVKAVVKVALCDPAAENTHRNAKCENSTL